MLDAMILLDVLNDRCDLLIECAAFVSLNCCFNVVHCKTIENIIGPAESGTYTVVVFAVVWTEW